MSRGLRVLAPLSLGTPTARAKSLLHAGGCFCTEPSAASIRPRRIRPCTCLHAATPSSIAASNCAGSHSPTCESCVTSPLLGIIAASMLPLCAATSCDEGSTCISVLLLRECTATELAATRSNISISASAIASDAHVMAAETTSPSCSSTRMCISTTDLGNLESTTAGSNAGLTRSGSSFSSSAGTSTPANGATLTLHDNLPVSDT
mmetsp:Transcript_13680/g.32162  ORF Transcript_13680/g.32162 Transcript_13680/m.32162 type:complete len:206 (-) Transcript_13680:300-917(-)